MLVLPIPRVVACEAMSPIHASASPPRNTARRPWLALARAAGVAAAVLSTACAAAPAKKPSAPLVTGEPSWPEDVERDAVRVDRMCQAREARLQAEYKEGKEEQESFKTLLGTITGGVGTAGGVVTGVGSYVIDSPDTAKTVTGVTGFVSGGLAAVGSVVTLVLSPGEAKMKSATQSLASLDEKRAAAHDVLEKKDPGAWSDSDKEAWAKAVGALEEECK